MPTAISGIMPSKVIGEAEIDARVEMSPSAVDILLYLKFNYCAKSNTKSDPNVELVLIQLVLQYFWLIVPNSGPYLLKQLRLCEMFFLVNFKIGFNVQMFVQIFSLLFDAFVRCRRRCGRG